jgi:hypothetical protein
LLGDRFRFAASACRCKPHPSLVLLAYTAAELLAMLPFTPGGLGFVAASLVGTLTLADVPSADALAVTLLYRIVGYWLPLPAGGMAYLLFRRRCDAGSVASDLRSGSSGIGRSREPMEPPPAIDHLGSVRAAVWGATSG